jgi:hypothetical protein
MKHTTNYTDTFIEVAEDCPVSKAQIPPEKETKTLAGFQYEKIIKSPYLFSSDDIIFEWYVIKNEITETEKQEEREKFFSKGQACFRASPLAKRYGFGFHHNSEGKVAIFPVESEEYQKFMENSSVAKVKAMRSKRK